MSSAHSVNARKCVHAQKHYPSQAFAHESSKDGGRGKRETGKTENSMLMERKAAQRNKNLSEELKQSLPRHSSGLIKQGEERQLPLAKKCDPPAPRKKHEVTTFLYTKAMNFDTI